MEYQERLHIQEAVLKIIANGVYGYTKFLKLNTNETYVPPTDEETIDQYHNDPFFKKAVDSIHHALKPVMLSLGIKIKD